MRKDLYTSGSVDLPKISKARSFFDLTHSNHLDMNAGVLYPIDCFPIMPGDSMEYGHRLNIRMTNPPKTPTMDQLCLDLFYFYTPNRVVWTNFDSFITNNSGSYYVDANYTVPILDVQGASASTYYNDLHCSVLDYLGYGGMNQIGAANASICNPNALPVRMYYTIWNEYFRFSPLQTEVLVPKNDTTITPFLLMSETMTYYDALRSTNVASWWSSHITKTLFDCVLMPVNRLPGYFSRALPQPIAGDDVKVLSDFQVNTVKVDTGSTKQGLIWTTSYTIAPGSTTGLTPYSSVNFSGNVGASDSNSIQALSNAFALNKFLYIDNLYGKRITEWTYGHFGVQVPDSRVQRPEFLGKKRVYININQIMQSSSTDSTSPQGNAGAWSQTFDKGHDFTKSFVEFGYIIGVACIRVLNHTFAQGVDKHWSARTRFDFPMLEFVNTGDEELKKFEIFFDNNAPTSTWGYQERYASWKMIPSRVSGQLRPTYSTPLSIWTYTDYYTSAPTLSATWMMEPRANIDNTLYIASSVAPQFILDYVADVKAYRTLPYHSIPGGLTGSW